MSAIPKRKMTVEEYIEFDKNNEGRWDGERSGVRLRGLRIDSQ